MSEAVSTVLCWCFSYPLFAPLVSLYVVVKFSPVFPLFVETGERKRACTVSDLQACSGLPGFWACFTTCCVSPFSLFAEPSFWFCLVKDMAGQTTTSHGCDEGLSWKHGLCFVPPENVVMDDTPGSGGVFVYMTLLERHPIFFVLYAKTFKKGLGNTSRSSTFSL